MPFAIEIRQLAKRFGAVKALDGVDLAISQGEFFGLLGPNGAGKTTLISILAGLCRADRGTARVMGWDVVSQYRQARRVLGVVPQELVFDPFFTVRETLRIQSGYFGLRRNDTWIDEVLEHLGLQGKASANMRSLSGGMKRRVLVAQALVHKPPVIVLDEPTAGVDVELRQSLWAFIRRLNESGHTIVLTTHYLEEAEALCGRIAMLRAGAVVALDATATLISRFHDHVYLRLKLEQGSLPAALQSRLTGRHGAHYMLRMHHVREVESLLACIRDSGGVIGEMSIEQPDLEEVFLQTMRAPVVESAGTGAETAGAA
jgi:ABC-2 type transport system ATP-binding protein